LARSSISGASTMPSWPSVRCRCRCSSNA
jgi:hypothetical protein